MNNTANVAEANITSDIGSLTGLSAKTLGELVDKINLCISSAIFMAKKEEKEILVLNIGIGQLSINMADFQCKFMPSKALKSAIKEGLDGKINPLELKLEEAIIEKLTAICQEVI